MLWAKVEAEIERHKDCSVLPGIIPAEHHSTTQNTNHSTTSYQEKGPRRRSSFLFENGLEHHMRRLSSKIIPHIWRDVTTFT